MAYNEMTSRAPSYLVTADNWNEIRTNFMALLPCTIVAVFDGGGSVLTTNMYLDIPVGFKSVITAANLLMTEGWGSDCSLTIDCWRDTQANYPPTSDDTITADVKFVGSSGDQNPAINISTWTTGITANDILRFRVEACALITKAVANIEINRSS